MRQDIFSTSTVLWVALVAAGIYLFYVSKDVRFKRRYLPRYIVLIGALCIYSTVRAGFPLEMMYFIVPAVALVTFLNIRALKFCDSCGRTIVNRTVFTETEYCPKCGAKLNG
jgi:hypothetical protein